MRNRTPRCQKTLENKGLRLLNSRTASGSFEGDVTVTPLAPPFLQVDVEAMGKATQLGQFTLDIPHVVNREKGTAAGSYEFTAANGDTLSADFTGQATPTATPGVLYIVETATITGGTGRFAGATGSFNVARLKNTLTGATTLQDAQASPVKPHFILNDLGDLLPEG